MIIHKPTNTHSLHSRLLLVHEDAAFRHADQLGLRLLDEQFLHLIPHVIGAVAEMHAVAPRLDGVLLRAGGTVLLLDLDVVADIGDEVVLGASHDGQQHAAALHHGQSVRSQRVQPLLALAGLAVLADEGAQRRNAHAENDVARGGAHGREEKVPHFEVADGEEDDGGVLLEEELVLGEATDAEQEESRERDDAVGLLDVVPDLLGGLHAVELGEQLVERQLLHHRVAVLVFEQRQRRQVQRQQQKLPRRRLRRHFVLCVVRGLGIPWIQL